MLALDPPITAGEVLRAFHHDEPFLFLGAAFNTVTIILLGLCIIRRKADGMLLSLAWFAHLYGIRLWINSDLLHLSIPPSEFFHRLSAAVDYLVPVPAFIFFHFAGFLGKIGKIITPVFTILFLSLSAGSMLFGTYAAFRYINNGVIAIALVSVAYRWFRRMVRDRDSRIVGLGLMCFVLPSLADNLIGPSHIEP